MASIRQKQCSRYTALVGVIKKYCAYVFIIHRGPIINLTFPQVQVSSEEKRIRLS